MKIKLLSLLLSILAVGCLQAQSPQFTGFPIYIEATVASGSTIAVTGSVMLVTGTTAIATITAPTGCTTATGDCYLLLIADTATGPFTLNTSGNIAVAESPAVGTMVALIYRPASSKWYPAINYPSLALPNANVGGTPMATPGTSITLVGPRMYAVCTGTCTVAVPVPPAAGTSNEFCIFNDDNVSTAITLSAIGSSVQYENSARTAYGTAGTGTLVVAASAANKVCIVSRDSTHYFTVSNAGGAITVN